MKSLRRLLWIAAVLGRHALAHSCGRCLERWPRLARRLPLAELPEPQRLRQILEDLGGTFVKLGQMLALQPDILPLEYWRLAGSWYERRAGGVRLRKSFTMLISFRFKPGAFNRLPALA